MEFGKEVRNEESGVVMAESIDLYGEIFDLVFRSRRADLFKTSNLIYERIQLMPEAPISPCFPVNIDIHNNMADSHSPAKYLDTRSPNQFRPPRLRHVKWFKDMIGVEDSQTTEDDNEEEFEEGRTVSADDLTGRFDP